MVDDLKDPNPTEKLREVPIDWDALENAFENNAPEVHSYLQIMTGDVLRIVDGVADPQMHALIASDHKYLRIEPVSSREQYRWMEEYIPTLDDPTIRAQLTVAIDGKGAFRRFKDVLMSYGPERENWFAYRSEHLKTFISAWLTAHHIKPIPRPRWTPPVGYDAAASGQSPRSVPHHQEYRRVRNTENLRRRLHELADKLGYRDLDTLIAFGDFLRARSIARANQAIYRNAPPVNHNAPGNGAEAAPSVSSDKSGDTADTAASAVSTEHNDSVSPEVREDDSARP